MSVRRVSRVLWRPREYPLALARCLGLGAVGVVHVLVAALLLVTLLATATGLLAFLLLPAVRLTRVWTALARRLARDWSGVEIAPPYLPKPPPAVRQPDGWYRDGRNLYRTPRVPDFNRWMNWLLRDPATWRDMAWVVSYAFGGALPALLPYGLAGCGLVLAYGLGASPLALLAVAGPVALGVLAAPWVLRLHGLWLRVLLGPTERSRLARRVRHLAESRTETVDSQAAQLRGIERDLHDGAQARLVAIGMTLGAADHLLDSDPAAAEALIAKAREASAAALAELRRLVRGIRPPVLAERGLPGALRALAVDSPLDVRLDGDLPEGVPAPIESAVYFAVSELLTNAARHGGAARATVALSHDDAGLTVAVTDDGRGGADPAKGSGLRGIRRRIAAFDGTLALDSPRGGPTTATVSVPAGPGEPGPVVPVDLGGPPRWRRWPAQVCLSVFALPLFPLGVVSMVYALAYGPDVVWIGWLGLAGREWQVMITMVLVGIGLFAVGMVLNVQNVRAARRPTTPQAEFVE
ncbi:sensor histidine kinase [Spongiactinospora gelatinilytica]|uniref:sensor histidine kinase n=1 Tax=Spongiactinospora gelatinilytica TaxID=2666298 RepID=UPI0011B93EED|nr:histidine kinase [Spongiactinospora gelatinilytica]